MVILCLHDLIMFVQTSFLQLKKRLHTYQYQWMIQVGQQISYHIIASNEIVFH
jgi:hypothetical protein